MIDRFKPRLAAWPMDPVLLHMRALASLSPSEETLLRSLGDRRERHSPGAELVVEGGSSDLPRFVLSGWAACQRVLPDGRRQIFRFILPGDVFGAPSGAAALWSVVALTSMELVQAEAAIAQARSGQAPGIARSLARARAIDDQLLLDHMVRLGQQTAYERVAHFLLELQRRLRVAGLGDAQRFPLPLTQEILADALGLSIVHVNRTLQQLRRDRLIELRSGVAILLKPDELASLCEYDAGGALPMPAPRQVANNPA
jgi:CRP-like cAMP-binding protein